MNSDEKMITFAELEELSKKYPRYLPLEVCSEVMGCKEAGLRASIDQGSCPFGISWKLGDRAAYKIPTYTFMSWYTNGRSLDEMFKS